MQIAETVVDLETSGVLDLRAAVQRLLADLDQKEIHVVARSVAFARHWRLTTLARIVTRLGNGWLYPIAAALLLMTSFKATLHCVIAAAVSLALAFTIYPPLKHVLSRTRPCHYDARLASGPAPMDRYACPSGHAMTAAAFGVPIIFAAPLVAAPLVAGGCLLVSWSRIALGHHYVSDIVAGTIIGGVIASVVAAFVV